MDAATGEAFADSDAAARMIYERLLAAVQRFGPVEIEPKKNVIHLVAGSAFAVVHPRKSGIILNVRMKGPIKSPRIRKSDQLSPNRSHNELWVSSVGEIDTELLKWLKEAYAMGAGKPA